MKATAHVFVHGLSEPFTISEADGRKLMAGAVATARDGTPTFAEVAEVGGVRDGKVAIRVDAIVAVRFEVDNRSPSAAVFG